MNTPARNPILSIVDQARIQWAVTRFDFWLDMSSVPGKQRRALRRELKSNLRDAADDVGVTAAFANVGPLRALAAETTSDGQLRSRWRAGFSAALTSLATLLLGFLFISLYYTEGVLDSGVIDPVESSLFPYIGSNVTIDPSGGGLAMSLEPGFLPLAGAALVFMLVAKPWRALTRRSASTDAASC